MIGWGATGSFLLLVSCRVFILIPSPAFNHFLMCTQYWDEDAWIEMEEWDEDEEEWDEDVDIDFMEEL